MNALELALIAWAGCALLFAAAFAFSKRINNYGVVDVVWSYAFGAVAVLYAALADGWGPRRMAIAALVLGWSVRLGTHLFIRVRSHHPEEDGRYRELRQRWADRLVPEMFKFFQLQGLSVVILAVPFLSIAVNPAPEFHFLEFVGLAIWLTGLGGEALADWQLASFKRDPANRGKVCSVGLWGLSRHPNYFFEWVIWVGFFVIACGSPWGWVSILSPASILYLLLRVTGIPMAEELSLKHRGEAYRRYQQTTRAFVPWPRRLR